MAAPEKKSTEPGKKSTVEEHAALVRSLVLLPVEPETVRLMDALGRVSHSAISSPVDLPLFRNSQMDGFAVLAADLAALPVTLPIVGEVAARPGEPAPLTAGTAVRVMTGATVPEGADAVVPVEDTTTDGGTVTITRARTSGEYVRERGSDLHAGDELLPAGLRLASRHLAALAAAGIGTVEVRRRPRVAVITTGAELVATGTQPGPGQIFDANAIAMVTAVRSAGAVVTFEGRVTDDAAALRDAFTAAAGAADVILTSGGISMGDYEVVREVLEPMGGAIGTVAMQPGGPQATAVFDGVPVICFPGNPVSTQLSFEIFVAPILREAAGLPAAAREMRQLTADLRSVAGKRQFLRARALPGERVELVSGPSSHLVAALAASDLLVDVPTETTELKKGDTVETWVL